MKLGVGVLRWIPWFAFASDISLVLRLAGGGNFVA